MNTSQKDYKTLFKKSRETRLLKSIQHLLEWDQETYMPEGGAGYRGEQVELMSGMIHKAETSPGYTKALSKLIDLETGTPKHEELTPRQAAAVKEWWRDWKRDTALPLKFVKKFAQLVSQSLIVWRKAKDENNFPTFAPYLERIIAMEREKADYLGWKEHPYDALINLYEHDITTKQIDALFKTIQLPIRELLNKITAAKQVDFSFLHGQFPTAKQFEVGNVILKDMGFSFTNGRVDISSHPFSSTITPLDSRITSRIHQHSLLSHLLVILHEGGHSLYDMGLPKEEYGSPLGDPISLGMHECQSRFWETRIGQSRPFWERYLPLLKDSFPDKFNSVSAEALYRGVNQVEPSFIRVDADEVTYPLHVVLRFEMERDLIAGKLATRDIPEVWNAKMVELLGVKPPDDRNGCLQDIHWAMGGFGYFPSYTLGTLYASHIFQAFERTYPDWEERITQGDLMFIREWLREKIHQYGRQYSSLELLKKTTGTELSSDAFIKYIQTKYKQIYTV